MNHCKDCKYWDAHLGDRGVTWNTCARLDWVDVADKIGDDEAAIYADASDDSGLDAGLKTGPLFGCIKFEKCSR